MADVLDDLNQLCVEAGICPVAPTDHELLLHFGQTELGSPGIVRDPARAKSSSCTCFKYKGKDICWTKGVIGTLSPEQKATYCTNKVYRSWWSGITGLRKRRKRPTGRLKRSPKGIGCNPG
jgi:hypothetical protein